MKWNPDYILNPAPGEIDPDRLEGWFREAIDSLQVPQEVFRYLREFNSWDVQNILVYGSKMLRNGSYHYSEIKGAPNLDEICRCLDEAARLIGRKVCDFDAWKPEPIIKVAWTDVQYAALLKGYHPDMDMRFATFHRNGSFFVYRSGYIVKKFQVAQGSDGLWHITGQFTTDKECTDDVLGAVIEYGYWDVPL